jgi:hypothetical protein
MPDRFAISLSKDEFDNTVTQLRLSAETAEIAYEALVNQAALATLASRFGKTPTEITRIAERVYTAWKRQAVTARVSLDDFKQAIATRPRLTQKTIDIARRGLVRGVSAGVLAQESGLSVTRINDILTDIYAACAKVTTVARLSESELKAALAGRRFSEQTIHVARAVLVHGEDMAEVARTWKVSRQRVSKIAADVYALHLVHGDYPPGWITETVTAPEDMLSEFRTAVEMKRKELLNKRR